MILKAKEHFVKEKKIYLGSLSFLCFFNLIKWFSRVFMLDFLKCLDSTNINLNKIYKQ